MMRPSTTTPLAAPTATVPQAHLPPVNDTPAVSMGSPKAAFALNMTDPQRTAWNKAAAQYNRVLSAHDAAVGEAVAGVAAVTTTAQTAAADHNAKIEALEKRLREESAATDKVSDTGRKAVEAIEKKIAAKDKLIARHQEERDGLLSDLAATKRQALRLSQDADKAVRDTIGELGVLRTSPPVEVTEATARKIAAKKNLARVQAKWRPRLQAKVRVLEKYQRRFGIPADFTARVLYPEEMNNGDSDDIDGINENSDDDAQQSAAAPEPATGGANDRLTTDGGSDTPEA